MSSEIVCCYVHNMNLLLVICFFSLDAVFVFTPTATHAEIICDSLKQGIFVFNILLEYMDQVEDLKKYKNIFDRKICDGGKTNSRNLLRHKNLL